MKWIKYIGHPVTLMCFYLLLLIEGDYFGGFYILYILMALPAGSPFAITAIIGLLIVLIGYKFQHSKLYFVKPTLLCVGFMLMILSLIIFFMRKERLQTFELIIPTTTFILFGICSFCFLINTIMLFKNKSPNRNELKMIL